MSKASKEFQEDHDRQVRQEVFDQVRALIDLELYDSVVEWARSLESAEDTWKNELQESFSQGYEAGLRKGQLDL